MYSPKQNTAACLHALLLVCLESGPRLLGNAVTSLRQSILCAVIYENGFREIRAGRRAPRTFRPGGGFTYAQGPHVKCKKFSSFKKYIQNIK